MNTVSVIQKFIIIASRKNFNTTQNVVYKQTCNNLVCIVRNSLIGLLLILAAYTGGTKSTPTETPTRGNIKISADESFQPLVEAEVYAFTHLYGNTKIKTGFKPEYDVINDFMNDSVVVIVTSKKLTDYQIQYLRDTQIIARTSTFAYDALALVTNKENKDTLLRYNTIREIFLGSTGSWKDINPKSKLGRIRVIFDNSKSGNIRYFKELFEIKDSLPANFFAVRSNAEVINFVSKNPDALGIISANWISDKDDSLSVSFTRKVRVLAISQQNVNDGYYYYPQQGFIANKSYPFIREVYLISRETFAGVGSGFINWVCAIQGQTIVLKAGLVPATMPIRLMQVKKE